VNGKSSPYGKRKTKEYRATKKETEDNYREVLVKQIPICSAMAWNYHKEPTYHDWCGLLWCCYHCPKARTECRNNGCAQHSPEGYPERCKQYPLTLEEAERILVEEQAKWEKEKWNYIRYSKAIDEYMKTKRVKTDIVC